MSLTNHIIIPIVGSKQNLEDQNIFVPNPFSITPSKHEEIPNFTLKKRSSSAFKIFKQKKDKKITKYLLNNQNQEPQHQPQPKYFQLRQRHNPTQPHQLNNEVVPFGYFDPNQAPLFEMHFDNECEYGLKLRQNKPRMEEEIQQIKLQRIQSQIIEDQPKFVIEPRSDDPFIIIRKDQHKKSQKTIKTKNIKKEKNSSRTKDVDQIKLMGGRVKEAIENSKDAVMNTATNQAFSAPILIISKTSDPIMEQSSSNSAQSQEDARSPISKRKQIQTIQNLINQSRPKQFNSTQQYCNSDEVKEQQLQQQQQFIQ